MKSPMLTIGVWVCAISTTALATLEIKNEMSRRTSRPELPEVVLPPACEAFVSAYSRCRALRGEDSSAEEWRDELSYKVVQGVDPAPGCTIALRDLANEYKAECPELSR